MKNVMNELVARGFVCEEKEVFKNGKPHKAISVQTDNPSVSAIIYDYQIEQMTIDEIVNMLDKSEVPAIDILKDKENIKNNIYVGLQQSSDTDIVKRFFHGLDAYLYIRISDEATTKVKMSLLDSVGLSVDEAWEIAYANTEKKFTITDMFGMKIASNGKLFDEPCTLGAGVIAVPSVQEKIKDQFGRVLIIPSSRHEVIIVPYDLVESYGINFFTQMIKEVNDTQVSEQDRLSYEPIELY